MLTKSSAMELAPFGIRVNCVSPSFVDTNLYRFAGLSEPEFDALKNRVKNTIPLNRIAKEVEVAKSIIYLSSENGLKITGQIFKVDGGKSLTSRGQADWYGQQYMNRKFESENNASYVNYTLQKQNIRPRPIGDKGDLADWVDENQTSNWAIQSDDAHKKALSMYVNQEENLTHLKHAAAAH